MIDYSTLCRDVFYFGDSNPDEVLVYRLHEWRADDRAIDMTASLSRKSDGNMIAHIVTRKVRPKPDSLARRSTGGTARCAR